MLKFGATWKQIQKIARENKKICTLVQDVPNEIVYVAGNSIAVVSERTGNERVLRREQFKSAWEFLVRHKHLDLEDAANLGLRGFRAIILAILAQLPHVEFTVHPLTLHLRREALDG